jgi:hypothetical protein
VWTTNAGRFTYSWFRDEYTPVGTGAQYTVSTDDAGSALTCAVTTASRAGRVTEFADVQAGKAPSPDVRVVIDGLPAITGRIPPTPGTVVTCSAPTFTPSGATVTQAWFAKSPFSESRTLISTDAALVLTEEVLRSLSSKELVCTVAATNAMGTSAPEARIMFRTLTVPEVFASVASVPVVTGTTATCTPTADAGTTLSYQWAIEPAPTYGPGFSASAQLLGTGPTYTLTDSDVTAISGGSKLACQVTASAWYGVASYVRPMP